MKGKGEHGGGEGASLGGSGVRGVGVNVLLVVGPEGGGWCAVESACDGGKWLAVLGGVDYGLAGHVVECIGQVKVDDGVVCVGVVMVFDVFVKGVSTINGTNTLLVWFKGGGEWLFGVVDVGAGGDSP